MEIGVFEECQDIFGATELGDVTPRFPVDLGLCVSDGESERRGGSEDIRVTRYLGRVLGKLAAGREVEKELMLACREEKFEIHLVIVDGDRIEVAVRQPYFLVLDFEIDHGLGAGDLFVLLLTVGFVVHDGQ